jgi:sialic acid synthase SpsE
MKKLYCHTINGKTIYPVIEKLDFVGLFPLFDGFSSHFFNWRQNVEAMKHGAKIIECHFKLNKPDIDCPDSRFALKPKEVEQIISQIRMEV